MLRVELFYRPEQGPDATVGLNFVSVHESQTETMRVEVVASDWTTILRMSGYPAWGEGGLALVARALRIVRHLAPEDVKAARPRFMKIEAWLTSPHSGASEELVSTLAYERRTTDMARICGAGWAGAGSGPMDTADDANVLEEAAKMCVMLGHEVASGRYPRTPEIPRLRDQCGEELVHIEDVPAGVIVWFKAFVSLFYPDAVFRNETMTTYAAWQAFRGLERASVNIDASTEVEG